MRLTTKGRFAVTAMLDLAMHSAHGPVTLAGISDSDRTGSVGWGGLALTLRTPPSH